MTKRRQQIAWAPYIGLLVMSFIGFGIPSLAHEGGHGVKVPGQGPHGGKMSAVISAADSEKGSAAPTQGVAEWKQQGPEIEVHLWDKSPMAGKPAAVSVPVADGAKSELKWIVLYGNHGEKKPARKPLVVKSELVATAATFKHAFTPEELTGAQTIEVILPAFGSITQKHVFEMSLGIPKGSRK
ncbi:MAG: hypothetical protein AB7P04_10550 [Bacteriovoracia bacterium]